MTCSVAPVNYFGGLPFCDLAAMLFAVIAVLFVAVVAFELYVRRLQARDEQKRPRL